MVISQSLTVTTTRVAIPTVDADSISGTSVWLYGEYHGSSNKVSIGGADVTMENGIHIYGGDKFGPIHLGHAETLYAVSDAAEGLDLRVLRVGA